MMLKVLTHNIGIILLVKELFYRACPGTFFGEIWVLLARSVLIDYGLLMVDN
jgi:hypothetical protein